MNKLIITLLAITLFAGCSLFGEKEKTEAPSPETKIEAEEVKVEEKVNWKEAMLVDVLTGDSFRVSDFDKPVLIESFAVWCPTCTKQQNNTKELHEEVGDSVISISLDTDPNEDKEKVIQHANNNGFDWYYVVSPVEFTKALIDEFGVNVVNAPSVPVILICGDQTRLLESGLKPADELIEEINKC